MNKDEIIAALQKQGVDFDPSANKATLQAFLDAQNTTGEPADTTEDTTIDDGISIADPVNIKTDLPLVVTLPADASKAQVAFAKIINAYAYQSPEKFSAKKADLLAQLREKKSAPDPVEDTRLTINQKNVI